ncbi:MAG: 4-vinyl reductase [Chloroflexi bacterium]|nr:4-vinyl reductase [Chloroflexota bacterium]
MDTVTPNPFYPNRMGRIILLAMEEVIGRNGLNAVLNLAALPRYIGDYPPHNQDLDIPFDTIARLHNALERSYGPRGGRGLALRAGRACLKYGLREFGPELGLTDLAFRLLPLPAKIKVGSEAFAGFFNHFTDQRVRLETDSHFIHWVIERCPLCWGRQTDSPACHLAVGLLQEALYWVSGGKHFNVEETHCIARGDPACRIVIDQVPFDT